ncbi:hypothetical protein QCE62_00190 [Caballeronia sp. LZ033]|uniref:hypothetical protein n=1 Tax=Caballeronia sp. LZ033 TaxID=3038566 RepID=UPI002864563E|nr:hypothetical protein [Caballeronia sp. LZ033]MDR5812006.1 hypothetical protein [Caballeronia sp. LZ033]
MLPIPSWAMKAIAGILLAVGLSTAFLVYRSHVYNDGVTAGLAQAAATQKAALEKAHAADAAAAAKATDALRTQLKDETNAHKARAGALESALSAARADGVRLSGQLASLHNDAVAGRSPGPAAAAAGPGPQGDPAEGNGASVVAGPSQFSLADLMRNDESNFTICRKNSARLTAIQDWYESLRNGDSAGQARAVAEAPSD